MFKSNFSYYSRNYSSIRSVPLSLKLVKYDALRIGIRIEFHSLGAVYDYDLSNKKERDLRTAKAPLTDDRSVGL